MEFTVEDAEELEKLNNSILNRCLIIRYLIEEDIFRETLPTLIEDNFADMQSMTDYCVVEDS